MAWWENRFATLGKHRLKLGTTPASNIVRRHGTPLFVYSRDQIRANYRRLRELFAAGPGREIRIAYALKANPFPGILEVLQAEGAWIDAVSPGEVHAALQAGFPPRRILFTGTSGGGSDFADAFAVDGLTVNIDAIEQLDIMKRVRDRWFRGKTIRVSVRWNPGLGRGFNPKVITAGITSPDGTPIKFGIEASKVVAAFSKAAECGFTPVGLHQHLGSGWVRNDFQPIVAAVDKMIAQAAALERKGFRLEFLDFGGGFVPRYAKDQELFPLRAYARHIFRGMRNAGLPDRAVALEPGKYLVADAGVLLLRVEYVKESYGNLFACVDSGTFNSLPRTAIYNLAYHEIVPASPARGGRKARVTIAGNLCETGDVFGKNMLMPVPRAGDILAVLCAGAYGRSMASNFNLRPIPKEIMI